MYTFAAMRSYPMPSRVSKLINPHPSRSWRRGTARWRPSAICGIAASKVKSILAASCFLCAGTTFRERSAKPRSPCINRHPRLNNRVTLGSLRATNFPQMELDASCANLHNDRLRSISCGLLDIGGTGGTESGSTESPGHIDLPGRFGRIRVIRPGDSRDAQFRRRTAQRVRVRLTTMHTITQRRPRLAHEYGRNASWSRMVSGVIN